jgi:hypothetical protein
VTNLRRRDHPRGASSSTDAQEPEEMSAFEKKRLATMAENQRKLMELGLVGK